MDGLRLRFVAARDKRVAQSFINTLPFKVNVRSIVYAEKQWVVWYVLPDSISNVSFNNVATKLKPLFESVDFGDLEL